MTHAEILAVHKAFGDEDARAAGTALAPGLHEVDVTVRVRGTVRRGEDFEQRIVAKADPWTLLGAALSRLNGVTVAALVRDAVSTDPDLAKQIKAQADAALAEIKAPTFTPCRGKVTTTLVVETAEERVAERLMGVA